MLIFKTINKKQKVFEIELIRRTVTFTYANQYQILVDA